MKTKMKPEVSGQTSEKNKIKFSKFKKYEVKMENDNLSNQHLLEWKEKLS